MEDTHRLGSQRTKRKTFGINPGSRVRQSAGTANPYDYEEKYAEDAYGEELGANARFWHVLLDESRVFDAEMVDGWRDTLDVLLVFAGLFSAVVTTLVVQSSQALQADYAQISASIMGEMLAVHRAWASGMPVDEVPRSRLDRDHVSATALDRWCNGLWFASLTLSLASALMAVLVKQWLQAYNSNVSGTPKHQALVRQFRFIGIEKWNVPLIIGVLPMLLHFALLLFFVGLTTYVFTFDTPIACIIIVMAISVYSLYIAANVLPMLDCQCPYKTPLSHHGYIILRCALRWILRRIDGAGNDPDMLPHPNQTTSVEGRQTASSTLGMHLMSPVVALSPRAREAQAVACDETSLMVQCLTWIHATSSNPSAASITAQAVSGLPAAIADEPLSHPEMLSEILARFQAVVKSRNTEDVSTCERLARSILFLSVPDNLRGQIRQATEELDRVVEAGELPSLTMELQGGIVALASLQPPGAIELRMLDVDSWEEMPLLFGEPTSLLRLHPVVWGHLLEFFSQVSFIRRHIGLHLALLIWRRAEATPVTSSIYPTLSREHLPGEATLMSSERPLLAIHRLLCGQSCSLTGHGDGSTASPASPWHLIMCALKSLESNAENLALKAAPSTSRYETSTRVYDSHIRFLSQKLQALPDPCAWDILETITRMVALPFAALDTRASLFYSYSDRAVVPPSFMQGYLSFISTLIRNLPTYGCTEAARHRHAPSILADVLCRLGRHVREHPARTLNAFRKEDVLAVLWPHAKALMRTNGRIEQRAMQVCEYIARTLGRYVESLANKVARAGSAGSLQSSMAIVENLRYLTKPQAHSWTESTHLMWCIAIDIFFMAHWTTRVVELEPLHRSLLVLANWTSRSHAKEWTAAVNHVGMVWPRDLLGLGEALKTTRGTQACQDFDEAILVGPRSIEHDVSNSGTSEAKGRGDDVLEVEEATSDSE